MDLILEKKDVFKSALHDWTTTWVPAILEYGSSCTGKTSAAVLQAKKDYEGAFNILCRTVLCR